MATPIVLCFVSLEDWPEYFRISDDIPDDADYDAFLKGVSEFCDRATANGQRVVKVQVQPAELLIWANSTGRKIDSQARSEYAGLRFIELNHQ